MAKIIAGFLSTDGGKTLLIGIGPDRDVAMLVLDHIGVELGATPDAGWWASRPIWLIGPLALLVPLVALFKRFE